MGAEQLSTTPDDTRISALCPDDRALDAASRSTMNAGTGPLDEQDDTGEPASAASAGDLRRATKIPREGTE